VKVINPTVIRQTGAEKNEGAMRTGREGVCGADKGCRSPTGASRASVYGSGLER
jgi:hypothetical protein